MVTTIGIVLWIVLVISISYIAGVLIYKEFKTSTKDFKYKINLYKRSGFENTNYPIIEVKLRDKDVYFLVDTGANINALSKEIYTQLNQGDTLKVKETQILTGVTGQAENTAEVIEETISISGEEFTEDFTLLSTWEDSRKTLSEVTGVDLIGIIGSDFFYKMKWMIDFDNLVIWKKK